MAVHLSDPISYSIHRLRVALFTLRRRLLIAQQIAETSICPDNLISYTGSV
jgi:hypothetical protein